MMMGTFPNGLGPGPPGTTWRRSSPRGGLSSFYLLKLLGIYLLWILSSCGNYSVMGTECMKRKYYEITISYFGGIQYNRTVKCDMYFQWTVADYCCYNKYDRFERDPFCCYSETYKLVLAVGTICLFLLAFSFSIFFCWVYNLPHHLLYVFTCGKFNLNNWMIRNKNGPYVDPSFYSGEPFWARGAEYQPYPLRPMPPKIFYPAPPPKLKYRWDMANGEIPLFIIASRQFTRNPYSARPSDRNSHTTQYHNQSSLLGSISESRRNSLSNNLSHLPGSAQDSSRNNTANPQHSRRDSSSALYNGAPYRGSSALVPYRSGGGNNNSNPPPPPFKVNIDEMEAAAELLEALKMLDERGDKTAAEWHAMSTAEDSGGGGGGGSTVQTTVGRRSNEIFMLTNSTPSLQTGVGNHLDRTVRPNTTGGGASLDHYGNYVSLTNHTSLALTSTSSMTSHRPIKPNTDAINQQFSTLGMPVYSMPGVHTAGVVTTVQNYHVVSSNLGNPMETILEDDSLDEEIVERDSERKMKAIGGSKKKNMKQAPSSSSSSSSSSASSSPARQSKTGFKKASSNGIRRPQLKRRATIMTSNIQTSSEIYDNSHNSHKTVLTSSASSSRVSSAMDHVVVQRPTTRAVVPFEPTLPGSLQEGSSRVLDAAFVDAVGKQIETPSGNGTGRRNSVV